VIVFARGYNAGGGSLVPRGALELYGAPRHYSAQPVTEDDVVDTFARYRAAAATAAGATATAGAYTLRYGLVVLIF